MSTTYCEDDAGNVYEINGDGNLVPVPRAVLRPASSAPLSERMEAVYAYIIECKTAHDGLSPTLREICAACSISSTSLVNYYLGRLEAAGRIKRCAYARGVEVVGGRWIAPEVEGP